MNDDKPEILTVVDENGIPDFSVNMRDLEATAHHLAASLAKECDTPEKVSRLLAEVSMRNVGHSVYLSGLLLLALKYLTEEFFAPTLITVEAALPEFDFRAKLNESANEAGEGSR